MTQMNFRKEVTSIMSSLNWATADEEYTPSTQTDPLVDDQLTVEQSSLRLNRPPENISLMVKKRDSTKESSLQTSSCKLGKSFLLGSSTGKTARCIEVKSSIPTTISGCLWPPNTTHTQY